jgi:hypothetical protein
MNNPADINPCNCHGNMQHKMADNSLSKIKRTGRSLPSICMTILIAFFPKCPVCWAVYMSMFGSVGLAQIPFMPWLLPVLVFILAIHLAMLYKSASQKGFLPFTISLAGTLMILAVRTFFPPEQWLLITGMTLVICGSLLNSFINTRISLN